MHFLEVPRNLLAVNIRLPQLRFYNIVPSALSGSVFISSQTASYLRKTRSALMMR